MIQRWKYPRNAVVVSVMLTLSGCVEFTSSTDVHRDGNLTRTVVVTGDSAEVHAGAFSLVLGSGWAFSRDTISGCRHRLTAVQTFSGASAMNAALNSDERPALRVTAAFESSFSWFTTVFTYSETWHRNNPFDTVPIAQFLSTTDLDLVRKHYSGEGTFDNPGDSVALVGIEERFSEWRRRNISKAMPSSSCRGCAGCRTLR